MTYKTDTLSTKQYEIHRILKVGKEPRDHLTYSPNFNSEILGSLLKVIGLVQ